MSWDFDPEFGAAPKAALTGNKNIVYVSPPATWAFKPLLQRVNGDGEEGLQNLFLVPGTVEALEMANLLNHHSSLGPAHPVTGIAHAARMAGQGATSLVATPADTLELLKAAAGGIREVKRVFVWQTDALLKRGESDNLDTILAECSSAQRFIHASDAVPTDFVERHARRAPVVGVPEQGKLPGQIRYSLVDEERVVWAVRKSLDIVSPNTVKIWDPVGRLRDEHDLNTAPTIQLSPETDDTPAELAIATDLPSLDILKQLVEVARDVVVLIRPAQLPFLRARCQSIKAIKLPSEADRVRDRAAQLRFRIREIVEADEDISFTLTALEPLFYEFDPAVVAAAVANLALKSVPEPGPADTLPTWVKIFMSVGAKAGLTTRDVVGAVLNSTGIDRSSLGKVEVKDAFTLVEVTPNVANKVVAELDGSTMKERRITARVDRKGRPAR